MSHSNHYGSFTIHYNGDYSGSYSINNSKRDEFDNVTENKYDSPTYISIEYKGGFKGLVKITKKAVFKLQKQFRISGVDDNGKRKSFLIDTNDVLHFIIEKERSEMISKIENMEPMEFFKKYISLGLMNWAIGVNIKK